MISLLPIFKMYIHIVILGLTMGYCGDQVFESDWCCTYLEKCNVFQYAHSSVDGLKAMGASVDESYIRNYQASDLLVIL